MEDRFVKKVMTVIEQYMDDTSFSVDVLAREMAMSNTQLYRKLKSLTGFTPNELIRNTRLERAASLLKQRAGNVADVAYQVGFNNLSYFSKCFKEKFGVGPSEKFGGLFSNPSGTYHDMGDIYLELKKFRQAIKYYELSLSSANATNLMDSHIASANSGLAEAYYRLGDFKKAIDYERKFSKLRDSLAIEVNSAEMIRLQNDFEQSRETDKIERLEQEATINTVIIQRTRTIQYLIAGILLMAVLGIIVLTKQYHDRGGSSLLFDPLQLGLPMIDRILSFHRRCCLTSSASLFHSCVKSDIGLTFLTGFVSPYLTSSISGVNVPNSLSQKINTVPKFLSRYW
jgi:AraC-like DNA-binding protein